MAVGRDITIKLDSKSNRALALVQAVESAESAPGWRNEEGTGLIVERAEAFLKFLEGPDVGEDL